MELVGKERSMEAHGTPQEIGPAETPGDEVPMKSPTMSNDNVESLSGNSSPVPAHESKIPSPDQLPWKSHFFRLGPLSGIACLGLAALSMLVSLGILLGSQGTAVAEWSVEPSAILAICTAIANQAMRYAAFQGVMIAWWWGGSV